MLSEYARNKVIDLLNGKAAFPLPAIYVAFATAAPTPSSTGSAFNEVAYTGYARKATAGSDWTAASGGAASNATKFEWPTAPAGTNQIGRYAVRLDAASGGNIIGFGPLVGANTPKPIVSITRSGTTATATVTGHGYTTGDQVDVSGATDALYNGNFTITVVDSNTFTYAMTGTPSANAVADTQGLTAVKLSPITIAENSKPTIDIGTYVESVR